MPGATPSDGDSDARPGQPPGLDCEGILSEWLQAVRSDPAIPSADELTTTALKDHIPEMLDALCEHLEGDKPESASAPASETGRHHGRMRLRQGYRLDELLRELARLRDIVIRHARLSQHGSPQTEHSIRIFFDEAAAISATQFTKHQESELLLRTQQLRSAYEQADAATEQLRAVADSRLRLVRAAVHELSNAMHSVTLVSNLLTQESDHSARGASMDVLMRNARHLQRLLDRLQTFSDLLAGESRVKREPVDVSEFLAGLEERFRLAAATKGLALEFAPDPAIVTITTDPDKLRAIAEILVENAIDCTRTGSVRVIVESHAPGRFALCVEDSGVGLRSSEASQIFREFHSSRADRHDGVGLGLVVGRHLAHLLDGEITFESSFGVGSRFRLHLPLHLGPNTPPSNPAWEA